MNSQQLILGIIFTVFGISVVQATPDKENPNPFGHFLSPAQDTIVPRYDDFINSGSRSPFDLKDPKVIDQEVEYDPETNQYIIIEKIGEDYYRAPTYMSFEEYLDYRAKQQEDNYFKALSGVSTGEGGGALSDPLDKIDVKKSLADRLFGGSKVDIKPQGNIDLTFGADFQKVENPTLTLRQQRQGGFDFDMAIQMNVTGSIGEKLKLSTNYNTQATFNFENQMKLHYDTEAFSEDDIIKNIEAGNVTFPLRSSLIQGSQNLFGFKIDTQWGRLKLSMVASQQKSRQQQMRLEGGTEIEEFEVYADEYDENRHFFLTHFNRETFEGALTNLPQIRSLFKINPGDIEVWVTNDRNEAFGVQDILAVADIGEAENITNNNPRFQAPAVPVFRDLLTGRGLPDNRANPLFQQLVRDSSRTRNIDQAVATLTTQYGLQQSKDFEKVSARLLDQSEFSFHPELGYISLNFNLRPDQVLGVAFKYDYNGKTYQVGELTRTGSGISTDTLNPPSVIFVKMLKSTTPRIDLPFWDLMMKNFYSLGAFQVSQEDFRLNIYYDDPQRGEIRFLPESNLKGVPLLRVFNLDTLNVQGDPCPDGIFDFVPGLTIQPKNGRIMFPVLEPFGEDLVEDIDDPVLSDKFNYFHLYDSTVTRAREYPELNRFVIRGEYKSSSGGQGPGQRGNQGQNSSREISLGAFNLPQGSVTVTAGGTRLNEGTDYTVDYNIGRVTILRDDLINSGTPINVNFEDNTLFGFQTKSMFGLRADYEVDPEFNIGATYLTLFERPFTPKVNIGDDPIRNSIVGLDLNLTRNAPWLTRAVDAIPFIDTKEESSISIQAEGAMLDPGHSRAINQGRTPSGRKDKSGVVYLDDFEGSTTSFDLRTPSTKWVLSSVPQNDPEDNNPFFPEADSINNLIYGVNRAHLQWYSIDPFYFDNSNDYTALITNDEVFPNRQVQPGFQNNIRTFDLLYDPNERGPYNFDLPVANGGTIHSAGITRDGFLAEPQTRWAGIMRELPVTNFEQANIEYIEFWMLNPFINGPNDGELVFNLGNISEDILRDSRRFFENGLPAGEQQSRVDTTEWSRVPRALELVDAFDNDGTNRTIQDVGLDGFDNEGERGHFNNVLSVYRNALTPQAFDLINADPSRDSFVFFRNLPAGTGTLDRYERFNGTEGNSAISDNSVVQSSGNGVQASTTLPDNEDLNQDNTLNESEAFYQYRIPLRAISEGAGFEIDMERTPYVTERQNNGNRSWYRFKVPIEQFSERVGGIQDFRAIRFIRMYLREFSNEVVLRFARLELARNQWRRYIRGDLRGIDDLTGGPIGNSGEQVLFDINDVNLEENSAKVPFRYVIPPGIQREQLNNSAFANLQQNEQAMSVEIRNLPRRDARAVYKNVNVDLRNYDRLRMFIHSEYLDRQNTDRDTGELVAFMRLGSDFNNNYYEYAIPLVNSDEIAAREENRSSEEYQRIIWPEANEMNVPMEVFREAKKRRNNRGESFAERSTPLFVDEDGNIVENPSQEQQNSLRRISLIGNPTLGPLRTIMVGFVNKSEDIVNAEFWVNELRLTGLDESAGFAGIGRVNMQLADLGDLALAAEYRGINFGGLEDRLHQRRRSELLQLDASTNIDLSKFFGEDASIKLPLYMQWSQTTETPEFDPYDRDIRLKDKLSDATSGAQRDSIREQAQDRTTLKSINLTNVRKVKGKNSSGKPMPWNIENFSVSYSYTEKESSDPFIEKDQTRTHNGALNYNYSRGAKYVSPLKKLSSNKWLRLITGFNFNPLPNSLSFNTVMNREKQVTKYRFTGLEDRFNTFYNKQWYWDRNYDLRWDLAKSLKFGYSATNSSVIDELKEFDPETQQLRDQGELRSYAWENVKNLGRTKNFNHNIDLSYTAPTKLIPILDWTTIRGQYNATYNWNAAALNTDSLGNVIQNTQGRQVSLDLDFERLYRKSKYLDKINRKPRSGRGRDSKNSNSRNKNDKNKKETVSDNKGKESKEGKNAKAKKEKSKKGNREPSVAERALIRPLMTLRRARLTYGEDLGTIVPGFLPQTKLLGLSEGFDAPGWDFVAGLQPEISTVDGENDWLNQAANKGWISGSIWQNQQVFQSYTQNIKAQVTLEPFRDFKIELNADKQFTEDKSLYFKDTTLTDNLIDPNSELVHLIPREMGSFRISYFTMQTLWDRDSRGLFDQFIQNGITISNRLGDLVGETSSHNKDDQQAYAKGFGKLQRDVVIPAFLAAYRGEDANSIELGRNYARNVLFKELPRINWQLNYNGLSRLDIFKDVLENFTLTHGYKSTLTVNSYSTDTDFDSTEPLRLDSTQFNYYSRFIMPDIAIEEQFAPLIGIDMTFKNGMGIRADLKKSRSLRYITTDNKLEETLSEEYIFGFNYLVQEVEFDFLQKNKRRRRSKEEETEEPKNNRGRNNRGGGRRGAGTGEPGDLNFIFDFSFRDDITNAYTLDNTGSIPVRGLKAIRISPSVDYTVSNQINVRLFFERSRTVPANSSGPPITTTQAGATIRFTLN